MTERQQLAEAIRQAWSEAALGPVDELAAAAVEPFLVAAERAGYERCKRDATTGIKAQKMPPSKYLSHSQRKFIMDRNGHMDEALAVVAALNATQQEASDG